MEEMGDRSQGTKELIASSDVSLQPSQRWHSLEGLADLRPLNTKELLREYGAQPDVWVRRRYQEERRWRSRMIPNPARPSLYDCLGGVYNIAPVVDDLIDRVMKDQRLNANPRVDEAHHRRGSSILSQKCYVRRPLGLSITRVGQWETHIGTS